MAVTFLTNIDKEEIDLRPYSRLKPTRWSPGGINDDANGYPNEYNKIANYCSYLLLDDDLIIINEDSEAKIWFYTRNDGQNSPCLGSTSEYLSGKIKVKEIAPKNAKYYVIMVRKKDKSNIDTPDDNGKYYGYYNVTVLNKPDISDIFDYSKYDTPKVYINEINEGDFASIKEKSDLIKCSYTYVNGINIKTGYCTLKWQGSSSIAYPKKNFTIKFYTDKACKTKDSEFEVVQGWGKQYKYVFKADWIDFSHSRNVVSAQLWGDVVKSRSDVNIEGTISNILKNVPNGGAIDGFPMFLIINNEWQGIYNWNIPKDDWTMGMEKKIGKKEVILCASGDNTASFSREAVVGTDDDPTKDYDLEYATNEKNQDGTINQDTLNGIQNSVNNLINKVLATNTMQTDEIPNYIDTEIAKYLDIQSAIDYFIFALLTDNYDGILKNYLLGSYDYELTDDNGERVDYGKWFFGAYDLDSLFGLTVNGQSTSSGNAYRPYNASLVDSITSTHLLFRLLWTYKHAEIKARYEELAKSSMSLSSVITKFTNYINKIPQTAYDADARLWFTVGNTSTNNLTQISDWYSNRLDALNSKLLDADKYETLYTTELIEAQPAISLDGLNLKKVQIYLEVPAMADYTTPPSLYVRLNAANFNSAKQVGFVSSFAKTAAQVIKIIIEKENGEFSADWTVVAASSTLGTINRYATEGNGSYITDKNIEIIHLRSTSSSMYIPAGTKIKIKGVRA